MALAVVHSLSASSPTRRVLDWMIGALVLTGIGAWAFMLGRQRFFQERRHRR